ncbi:hypothetical protein DSM112329_02349 [Paraconexibacter sp. AEG42_29]|uniref:Uncharacterized protein n=1 Tax=Paraconexibacter sp. AEG42_29 TaxID=2997339 RepID=A0AAU7AV31_9ACTN
MADLVPTAVPRPSAAAGGLPELAGMPWRRRVDDARLRRAGRGWTVSTTAHVVPFLTAGTVLFLVEPLATPVSLACFAHAWIIPELYAQRGANVVRPKPTKAGAGPEARALGLLGDLVGHEARDLHGETGLIMERGRLGVWLLGPAGALLVRPGGRRTHCLCVRVNDPQLPSADRIAHLLLALRADEEGFATVANQSFSGATWRVRRRLAAVQRPALKVAAAAARAPRASADPA